MPKTPRSAIAIAIALLISAASAVPVGGYGLEKTGTTTSISIGK
ncbi:hypothetical protein [Deinococcus sp.]|nr:hypothetical protein [Deinococcus sp.]